MAIAPESTEVPGYLSYGPDQIYVVHHRTVTPRRGGVVIASPFATERSDSYLTCVRWARMLAASGYDVIRFDYRGTGESTGAFPQLTLRDWQDDVRTATSLLKSTIGPAPVILHGMRMGALLVSDIFAEGVGDAMLLWAPPPSARDHLWEVLRSTLTADLVQRRGASRRTRDDCVRQIESGQAVNVGGYFWNHALWTSSADRPLRIPDTRESRPWRLVDVRFKARTGALADPHRREVECDRFWEESTMTTADITPLAADARTWMETATTVSSAVPIARSA